MFYLQIIIKLMLHAKIGDKEILKGINLTIKDGETHAIMGPNGSGTVSYTHLDVYKRQAHSHAQRHLYRKHGGGV